MLSKVGTVYPIQKLRVMNVKTGEVTELPQPAQVAFRAKSAPADGVEFDDVKVYKISDMKPVTITLRFTCLTERRIRLLWRYCDDFKADFWRENFVHQFQHRYGFSKN